jgi:hypothetical protein
MPELTPSLSPALTERSHAALEEARRLAETIRSPDVREAALAEVGQGWAAWQNPGRAHPLVDRISPNQDPFPQSPWGALHRARVALAYAHMGSGDGALSRFEGALSKFAEVPAPARAGLAGPFCEALVRAHEVLGDPRLIELTERLAGLEGSPSERVQALAALLQMELNLTRLDGARRASERLLELLRAPHRLDEPSLDRLVEFTIAYVEATADRAALTELQDRGLPQLGRPLSIKAEALLGRVYREMGEPLRGERMLRGAQEDLPSLKGVADRVRIGLDLALLLARDGNLPGTETLLQWSREQTLPLTRPGVASPFEEILMRGHANAFSALGQTEELRREAKAWQEGPAGPLRETGVEFLVRRWVDLASEPPLLAARLRRLRERLEVSAPETFRRLATEAEQALVTGDLVEARKATQRASRVGLAFLAETPDLVEVWTTLRELTDHLDRWDPRWGDRGRLLRSIDDAQEALRAQDWRRLRQSLRRARELLREGETLTAGGGAPSSDRSTSPPPGTGAGTADG